MTEKWYVVHKDSGHAATFFLKGPECGQPVPFDTKGKAQENADFLQGAGGFYQEGSIASKGQRQQPTARQLVTENLGDAQKLPLTPQLHNGILLVSSRTTSADAGETQTE